LVFGVVVVSEIVMRSCPSGTASVWRYQYYACDYHVYLVLNKAILFLNDSKFAPIMPIVDVTYIA
ncbi:hypothetical protein AM593_08173, partial [Mytilus galloprovincialis]